MYRTFFALTIASCAVLGPACANRSVPEVSLRSDVLIATHHGANNGSAMCFIQAVDPEFVIFSADHAHQHPTHAARGKHPHSHF